VATTLDSRFVGVTAGLGTCRTLSCTGSKNIRPGHPDRRGHRRDDQPGHQAQQASRPGQQNRQVVVLDRDLPGIHGDTLCRGGRRVSCPVRRLHLDRPRRLTRLRGTGGRKLRPLAGVTGQARCEQVQSSPGAVAGGLPAASGSLESGAQHRDQGNSGDERLS
jgi:hypothetical protein